MHVAITGASSGIGEAIAREFGAAGAKLTLIARRRDLLDKLAGEIDPARCHVVAKDLADAAHACDWIAAAEAAHGPIDVMVNNAGMENTGPTIAADLGEAERLLLLNLHTPLFIMHALAPKMIARGAGSLVNIASLAAIVAPPGQAWYGASKAGLAMFSETLGGELRKTGVHVLTVYPGPVTTPMGDAAYEKFGGKKGAAAMLPVGKPDVLARRIRRAVESKSARIIYPRQYHMARLFTDFSRWTTARSAKLKGQTT